MVAEEAGECSCERLGLAGERVVSIGCPRRHLRERALALFRSQPTFLGPCGFLELLRLPCRSSVQSALFPVARWRGIGRNEGGGVPWRGCMNGRGDLGVKRRRQSGRWSVSAGAGRVGVEVSCGDAVVVALRDATPGCESLRVPKSRHWPTARVGESTRGCRCWRHCAQLVWDLWYGAHGLRSTKENPRYGWIPRRLGGRADGYPARAGPPIRSSMGIPRLYVPPPIREETSCAFPSPWCCACMGCCPMGWCPSMKMDDDGRLLGPWERTTSTVQSHRLPRWPSIWPGCSHAPCRGYFHSPRMRPRRQRMQSKAHGLKRYAKPLSGYGHLCTRRATSLIDPRGMAG